jgi:2,3-dihydroxybenzoate decarboxylase
VKIALEEHVLADRPGLFERWMELLPPTASPTFVETMRARLADVGAARLEAMDAAGIELAVLSSVATVQGAGLAAGEALRLARAANDALADVVRDRPDRYAGLATVPLQDAAAGAAELERAVRELGLLGAMVFGATDGRYLDDERYFPFWERVEALGVPVYLHAADAPVPIASYEGRPELLGATWSWTAETATHALRVVLGGVFDRFPGAQLVLGHMGEALPFLFWRVDRRIAATGGVGRRPSEAFRHNVSVTTAGVCADAPLVCALAERGEDRVMFSVDHPFEDGLEAARWLDGAPLEAGVRAAVEHGNARRLLAL